MSNKIVIGMAVLAVVICGLSLYAWRQTLSSTYTGPVQIAQELATVTWNDFIFRLSLDQSVIDALETEARWVITNTFTEKTTVPNYLFFIFVDGLKAVQPWAVTIVSQ
jgi:hypothetical protein